MKKHLDIHRDIWGPYMTLITNLWAESVFKSVDNLRRRSIYINNTEGLFPQLDSQPQNQEKLTKDGIFFRQLHNTPEDQKKVTYFSLCAEEYELVTERFKSYFLDRAFEIIQLQTDQNYYILDAACGPGYELEKLQALVPNGEVIGIDLSGDMIKRANRNARIKKLPNVGFYQADLNRLPAEFTDHFDLIFCNISLHYFETVENVFHQFYKALRNNGKLIFIEPLGSITQKLSKAVLKEAIPHFKRFYSKKEQNQFLGQAGFTFLYWEEIQKNIGLTIAIK